MIDGPLKWHGGKHYLAPKIVALMPPHLHYVEPFFGGGAVLLAKNPDGVSEVVNDLDGDLINFWKVLADEATFEMEDWNEFGPKTQGEFFQRIKDR
jgi:DNA adenine methylase